MANLYLVPRPTLMPNVVVSPARDLGAFRGLLWAILLEAAAAAGGYLCCFLWRLPW